MTYEELADLIKRKRFLGNLTQKQVSLLIPCKPSTYFRIENGQQEPNFYQLKRLIEIFNLNVNEIFASKKPGHYNYD